MGTDYDSYLKAWKKPVKPVTPSPMPATPVKVEIPKTKVPDAPDVKPPLSTPLSHETARAQAQLVKKEFPNWTDAQVRREAARRMNADYDDYLRAWKRPKDYKSPVKNKPHTPSQPTVRIPEPPTRTETIFKRKTTTPGQIQTPDRLAVNPGYKRIAGTENNCPSTSTTYELRMRGYDVQAVHMDAGAPVYKIYDSWGLGTPRKIDIVGWEETTFKAYPDGARGFITCVWEDGSGSHIYNWEKRNGRLWYIDAQTGEEWRATSLHRDRYLRDAHEWAYITRVDHVRENARLNWLTQDSKG